MRRITKITVIILFVLIVLGLYQTYKEGGLLTRLISNPDCRIINIDTVPDSYFVNDAFDFGYTVKAEIHNTGQQGTIRIETTLSTSEGSYQRDQELILDADQRLQLYYQFPEPTLNASNIQAHIKCMPSSENSD